MPYVSPAKVRENFNSQAARDAFDRINALGPSWVMYRQDGGMLYIAPSIETKSIGGGMLRGIGGQSNSDPDELICRYERSLINHAAHPNTLVVINAGEANRREYRYDAEQKDFVLYSGSLDSGKPFSIKLKKPGA